MESGFVHVSVGFLEKNIWYRDIIGFVLELFGSYLPGHSILKQMCVLSWGKDWHYPTTSINKISEQADFKTRNGPYDPKSTVGCRLY